MANTPTYYWGQGFHAGDKDNEKEKYTAQVLTLRPTIYRQLFDNVYLGAGWSLAAQNADEMDHDDLPKIESTSQGPSVFSSGASVALNWDDRDFVPNPRRGQYANVRYTHYAPGLGSDTRFDEFQLHYSHYHALSEKSVLAWEADGAFTQGEVPWSMMPLLGSDERMRGYYEGRYRDKKRRQRPAGISSAAHLAAWDCGLGRGGNHGAVAVVVEQWPLAAHRRRWLPFRVQTSGEYSPRLWHR